MNRLFIIGNGFDLAHGMKTSYTHFQQYLQKKYPNANSERIILPSGTPLPKGGVKYREDEIVGFLMHIISNAESNGDKWSDLENTLGMLDFSECFEQFSPILDKEGDYDDWKNMYSNSDLAADLVTPCLMITDFFSDWIDTIEINNKIASKSDFAELIDQKNDLFLTFNYTTTLEVIYKVENICHIHGEQGEKLIFGHGNDSDNYEENMVRYPGAEDSLQKIQDLLRKKTDEAITNNIDFFNEISTRIDKIYSYGFSFSKVDEIYIKKICNSLQTNRIVWYLNDYDSPYIRKCYKDTIQKCNFEGRFCTFHIT